MRVSDEAVLWMVDDNPADLDIVGIVCETLGFPGRFVALTGGEEALERLRAGWERPAERPDVILLDVNMPRLSGLGVLRALRQDPRWADLPVAMFSTSGNEREVAMRDGATAYLLKPSLLSETVGVIREVVARFCKHIPTG